MTRPIIITLHGRAGPQRLELGPTELAAFTERQRDALSRHVAGEPGWSRPLNRGAPPIGLADLATLARLLDLRAISLLPCVLPPSRARAAIDRVRQLDALEWRNVQLLAERLTGGHGPVMVLDSVLEWWGPPGATTMEAIDNPTELARDVAALIGPPSDAPTKDER